MTPPAPAHPAAPGEPTPPGAAAGSPPAAVLTAVAAAAADDAGGLDPELLDDFLDAVWHAVAERRRLSAARTARYRRRGEQAAADGVALRALLDLYLSAAWRLWRELPPVTAARTPAGTGEPGGAAATAVDLPAHLAAAGEVVLRAADDAAAALAEGYQLARRHLVPREEVARREFVDDLLGGSSDVPGLLRRAARFGLDLAAPHAVCLARTPEPLTEGTRLVPRLERALRGARADADALVAVKDGALVVVFAAPDPAAVDLVVQRLADLLGHRPPTDPTASQGPRGHTPHGRWHAGVGRPGHGPGGVVASYEEARHALDVGARLDLTDRHGRPVSDASDLLVYEVLLRDRTAAADLVEHHLGPLRAARGGPTPYLRTLQTWFDTGGNATETARRLHLSVRAVTYRLDRVRDLTGLDPAHHRDRFGLHAAVLAARALDWPHP
ncbi:PucR family transcriptional regulator [Kineococcus sp. SYSU DK004]|uniref:PucR family transcriptional regulator n=1 Tax=Kineococcus sp. SYSU DK004 TaxID=3383125 RepID=UPI003D7D305E